MDPIVLIVFAAVYLGMMRGRIPGLALDRTGIALLGAAALLAARRLTIPQAWDSIDLHTIALLLGLMLLSAQFHLAGAYTLLTNRFAHAHVSPRALLALLIALVGTLAALLGNDIVCLALAPIIVHAARRRNLDPVPFLIALATAANVGSAATLIGNPQIILIGQSLHLSFTRYLLTAAVPTILSLAVVWLVICLATADRWHRPDPTPGSTSHTTPEPHLDLDQPLVNRWQTAKALLALAAVILIFLLTPWPRAVVALALGSALLLSRTTHSRRMLAHVDWQLLLLFVGLFVVNRALETTPTYHHALAAAQSVGWNLAHPAPLFVTTAVLSNLVSNVPAVMLLLPAAAGTTNPHLNGAALALASTFAGNFLIVGSIANIIVVTQARRLGLTITWRTHARIGIPVTLLTLAIAAAWLYLIRSF